MKNNEHNFDKEPNLPFDENGNNPFGLPIDYFSSFEDKLKKRLDTESELSQFPLLASISKESPFFLPKNYFSLFEGKIECVIELEAYSALQSIKSAAFGDLEQEYSDYLNLAIQRKTELIDELKAYETLYNLDKVNAFSLPEQYFENLNLSIKEKVHAKIEREILLLDRVLEFLFGKRMALSFGVLIVITISVFVYQTSIQPIQSGDCKTLACLEKREILNNSTINNFDEEQLMDLVDVNALGKQLQKKVVDTDSLQQEEFIIDNIDTDQLLEEL